MGHLMRDHFQGQEVHEVVEREDGFIESTSGPASYFAPFEEWGLHEQRAMASARGRVLDIGVGAGRHALYLQDQGLDVTGADISPLALRVARERGLGHTVEAGVPQLSRRLGTFDTLLMMGDQLRTVRQPAPDAMASSPIRGNDWGRCSRYRGDEGCMPDRRSGASGVPGLQPPAREDVWADPNPSPVQAVRDPLVRLPDGFPGGTARSPRGLGLAGKGVRGARWGDLYRRPRKAIGAPD